MSTRTQIILGLAALLIIFLVAFGFLPGSLR
jgi:hypothetical protein